MLGEPLAKVVVLTKNVLTNLSLQIREGDFVSTTCCRRRCFDAVQFDFCDRQLKWLQAFMHVPGSDDGVLCSSLLTPLASAVPLFTLSGV